MARPRRGGFRGPELRGTLGTLLRTTIAQAGVVRDALERGAREGRSRLDDALSGRRRTDALAELGEIVLDLIRRGEIDLGELPEVRELVEHLDELDAGAGHDAHDDRDAPEPARPARRERFDERAVPGRAPAPRTGRTAQGDDDGTVSSGTWSPPGRGKPAARVWRPLADPIEADPHDAPAAEPRRAAAPARPLPNPHRKGGITFEDDDLAEYMHPDDVPKRDPGDADS